MNANSRSHRLPLSVVVPIYNEQAGIRPLVRALVDLVERESGRRAVEIILVDDGSDDGTWSDLRSLSPADDPRWRLIRHDRNRGLTAALRTGTEAATLDLVGWLDADLTYDATTLARLADAVDRGADLGLASCHHPDGRLEGVPGYRRWLSRTASRLYRSATGHALHTFTCMVRVQPRELALATWPDRQGFLGVTEQLLRSLERGARVAEVPAVLRARVTGASKMKIGRVARAHFGLVRAARRGLSSPRGPHPAPTLVVDDGSSTPTAYDRDTLSRLPAQLDDVGAEFPGRAGRAVRVTALLSDPSDDARAIEVVSRDGAFRRRVPIDTARHGVVVHSFEGGTLPLRLGGPFRLLVPASDACVNVRDLGRVTVHRH